MRAGYWLTLSILTATLAACGGGGGGSSTPAPAPTPPPPEPEPTPTCTLTITTPPSGAVSSSSGDYDCAADGQCVFTIESDTFSQTFTAVPNTDFQFQQWTDSNDALCVGEGAECAVEVNVGGSSGACAGSAGSASLSPEFEAIPAPNPDGSVTLSGVIRVLGESRLDSDTNNPDNGTIANSNDTIASAQPLSAPATVGGYLNDSGLGADGVTQIRGDFDDFYQVEAQAGQVITLYAADYTESDLDLWLYDADGEPVDVSAGTGEIEQLTIPYDGVWYINPYLYSGASSYVLTVGVGAGLQQAGVPIPGEVLVAYDAESLLLPDINAQRRHDVEHKLALKQVGGGIARTRRLRSSPATLAALDIGNNPRLSATYAQLASKPDLRERWETWLLAKAVAREPSVAYASPNFRVQASATTNDSFINYLWHYELINVPAAWDLTTGDPSVIVAVIDTGIIADHPDLAGQLVPGYDFIADPESAGDGDGLDADPTDEGEGSNAFRSGNYHGLHVAGTVAAAGNNGRGIAGVAYGTQLMPLRALNADGSGSSYDIMQAVRFAAGLSNDSGTLPAEPADVINLSVGGGGFSQIEQNLYNTVRQRGILVAAASGNDGASSVGYPAAYNHVFAIGATDAQGSVTSYSNQGSALDMVAPGGRMEADLNSDGQPDGVLSTYYSDGTPEYSFLQGTSMATPHAAGVFALMRSVNPALDNDDVEALLQAGALTDDLGPQGRDNTYGWGLINARKAVAAALDAAGGTLDIPAQLGLSTSSFNYGTSLTSGDVILSNLGDGTLSVSGATVSDTWLSAAPQNVDASGLGTWRVRVDRGGLAPGSYQGSVVFGASSGDRSLNISMRVASETSGDVGTVYVLFIDADSQEVVAQAVTNQNSDYRFTQPNLPAGRYEIWAGTDTDNDFFICDEGETCGAFQTLDSPLIVTLEANRDDIDFSSDYQIRLPSVSAVTVSGRDALARARR